MSVLKVEEGISDEKKKDVILHSDGIVSVQHCLSLLLNH